MKNKSQIIVIVLIAIVVLLLGCQEMPKTSQETETTENAKIPTVQELEAELDDLQETLGLEDLDALNKEVDELDALEDQT